MEDSLKKRYSIKLLANIVTGLINAILVAIVPKALGPIAYGEFVYLQNFFMKFIGFLDMGSSIAFFTKLSANHQRKELIVFYFAYAFFVMFILVVSIYGMLFFHYSEVFLPQIPQEYIFMGLFFSFFTWLTQVFIKISDAYALTVSVELIKIFHKLFSLLLLFFILSWNDFTLYKYYLFHYLVLVVFIGVLFWLFSKKEIFIDLHINSLTNHFRTLVKEFYAYCHPLFFYSIIGLGAGFFDIWLLQKVAGSEQTGFYGVAYSLAAMCFLFTSAMTPIITREFSKSYEQKDFKNMRKLFFRYIPMLYSIAAYFAVFVSIQSDNILAIFTDVRFHDAEAVLMVMALYPIHQTYGQLSGSIFYATGQTKLMRNIALFTQPLGMIVSLVLIYFFDLGALGLAQKMVLIQFIGVTIQLFFNAKLLKFDMRYFLWHQLYSILFFALLAFFVSGIVGADTPFKAFLFSGVLYTVLVIIFVYIVPQIFGVTREELLSFRELLMEKIRKIS